jgi:hypothetical protein
VRWVGGGGCEMGLGRLFSMAFKGGDAVFESLELFGEFL